MCEPSEWSAGPSDIEGKTTRVGASKRGQRTSFNHTRVAGHPDEIQRVVANTLDSFRNAASLLANSFGVGFIDWLGAEEDKHTKLVPKSTINLCHCTQNPKPPPHKVGGANSTTFPAGSRKYPFVAQQLYGGFARNMRTGNCVRQHQHHRSS